MLGTFGKIILFFCPTPLAEEQATDVPPASTLTPSTSDKKELKTKLKYQKFRYELKRELAFKHSILGLAKTCLSYNGAYDLVVLTLNGISIWQYEPDRLAEIINQKFEENEQKCLDLIASKLVKIN